MKNNKGISMITLIITIIVMIILLGLAYRVGTRYIDESKEQERSALISIMSTAVESRQNDNYVGLESAKSYYSGYHISSGDFEKISSLFDTNDFTYEPGLWYLIDATSAGDLGVIDASNYLVSDINNSSSEKGKYIAVADYYTGAVHLIHYEDVERIEIDLDKIKTGEDGVHDPSHEPIWTVATCTEPSICKICGFVNTQALGHHFNLDEATCTEDKKCERCGYIEQKATGHVYNMEELSYTPTGHYHPCIRCGTAGHFEEHTLHYSIRTGDDKWTHDIWCEKADGTRCGYTAVEDCNIAYRQKDSLEHIKYCTDCGREETTPHDEPYIYKYIDKEEHAAYCETCGAELFREEHVDLEAPYGVCDKCDGAMDLTQKPFLTAKMQKQGDSLTEEEKYIAKYGDTVVVTIESNVVLADIPTVKMQNIEIKEADIKKYGSNAYTVTVKTDEYDFVDGLFTIEVSKAKSLWGVNADTVSETIDGKYVDYDGTLPDYMYIP
ncbi:MAG: hypothetical protein IJ220_07150 [Clostridia bacterium]|nr:hypothetical protein [Clostridia bacterium]